MRFSKLTAPLSQSYTVDVFGGYNHNARIGEGEFYDEKNITSDQFPAIASRPMRGTYTTPEYSANGLISKDTLCYVDGSDFVINGYRFDMGLSSGEKTLVSMGAYVIILPDKKWINTADTTNDGDFENGDIEAKYESTGESITFSVCNIDGDPYEDIVPSNTEPESTDRTWLDTSDTPHVLKKYASASGMWVTIPTTYVMISARGIGASFEKYDGVNISGITADGADHLNASAVIQKRDNDYIVVIGIIDETVTQSPENGSVKVERTMPEMDFVIESGNRLWGCRYGTATNGKVVNEIYASKLGDFKNWNCFQGISTDSFVASVGTDGQFTGAITHGGYPVFFKEAHLHKVYGDYTGAYSVQSVPCRGVQRGSHKSMAIVNEILYYKSVSGVCAYDGSLPVDISGQLGVVTYYNAVGGGVGNKYYVSMSDAEIGGAYNLFVYDVAKALWHKEDDTQADSFCASRNNLYYIDHKDGNIKTIFGGSNPDEDDVDWMLTTGVIGTDHPGKKYISRLNVRMELRPGSQARFYIEYDSSGVFEHVYTMTGTRLSSVAVPIRPHRCDHLRLKIDGFGDFKIFSITKTIEQGSDIR